MGANSLPKTVTRQRRGCDLNPGPSVPESSMLLLTTRLPSHQGCVYVCISYHITEMPVVLVFGVATTIDSIHRSLPHRVTSLLSMAKFQAPSSSDYLSTVLHQVSKFLSSISRSHCLTFFGCLARMGENADASQAIFEPPPKQPHTTWMKNVHDDLSSLDLGIHEARDLVQNRPLWRLMSLHSDTHS